ncbi:hypothetical protein L6164_023671 [Bauhinia variegata]|uniref:Uncharacterized protein n=1 Tax=Bauhinia variegata TaxID=167791 RepID=A0ACB9MKA8_BAUVA|nr:hypothetical protein L6164_023671 [Bauhinia variegata]
MKAFNGFLKSKIDLDALIGEEVYQWVKDINVIFGKTQMWAHEKSFWKKRSILFDFPYWPILDVRNCVDVMHVEKTCVIVLSKHFSTYRARKRMM